MCALLLRTGEAALGQTCMRDNMRNILGLWRYGTGEVRWGRLVWLGEGTGSAVVMRWYLGWQGMVR
jgi:hypothetical protein